jgi:hypothetical protein
LVAAIPEAPDSSWPCREYYPEAFAGATVFSGRPAKMRGGKFLAVHRRGRCGQPGDFFPRQTATFFETAVFPLT